MRYSLFVSDRDDSPISTFTRLNCTFCTLGSHDLCRKPCSGSDKSVKKSACFTPASFSSSPPSSGCCDPLASSSRARDPEELERKRAGGGERDLNKRETYFINQRLTPLFTTLQELLHNKRDDFKKISRFYARL
ncbi:Serine/threonine-protein phosphatase 2A activator 1 [Dissostichus eleginoides]|uniref:Serine/threonine-protein phosphatase 2A activator 1 n=1 Tax=Dissostichus eleginoides TaxID=100907 RepID=A0AAD9BX96_DISEL|nr:Serine/threonine-protein phosphatase 2A activator 1 [Dissostichus eleginoides]